MGKVYLIGAGPGDEELITLKAVRVLKECTAVLYDRLANPSLLKYLPDNCEIYYCGKEPGCHYKSQDEINSMLSDLALKGHTVARIKGGDPFVFGRGGEEILELNKHNIEFEVIPGITSAIAVLNYAGIPITHRKIAQSFHVFTGMSAETLDLDWDAAARLKGTLVFLMGLSSIEFITSKLIEKGMDENKPCAVIMRGTTSKQKKAVGNLSNIASIVREKGFESPCIIVVGDVVNFNESFDWYSKKPLSGRNICITRSKEQAGELRQKLFELGAEVTEINTIVIKDTSESLDEIIDNLKEYSYIILTSVNAVKVLFSYLRRNRYDIRKIRADFAVIGPATAEALRDCGIEPSICADEFVAEDLYEKLKDKVKVGDRILLPRSKKARAYLKEELIKLGALVDEKAIYDAEHGSQSMGLEGVDTILFTSPTTVRNLISMEGIDNIKGKSCIAIGPITSKELQKNNIEHIVSSVYTTSGMIDMLVYKEE